MRCASFTAGRVGVIVELVGVLVALPACTGSQFGSEIGARPKLRLVRSVERATLHLPKDEAFTIALPSVTKKAGFDGTADGDATARATGDAEVTASVNKSGTAESVFQLGHALANDTDRQMDFDFTVRFHYEFVASNEPPEHLPDATVGLRLYARDDRGRLLRDMVLVDHSTENGAAHRAADETLSFTVTLGPGGWVNVFLAGLAKADIPADRSASATLKLGGLELDVVTQPAPALPAVKDGHE